MSRGSLCSKTNPQIRLALLDIICNVAFVMHFQQIGSAGFLDLREIIGCTANIVALKPFAAWSQAHKSVIVEGFSTIVPQMRKQPVWLAATRSFTTPEIAPAFAAAKRSFAGSRMSIEGKGLIWRSGLGEDDDVLVVVTRFEDSRSFNNNYFHH